MLCAKYDYKTDIAVQREEAFEQEKKAIEDVRAFFENGVSIDLIAKSMKMIEEQVKEIVSTHAKEAVTV